MLDILKIEAIYWIKKNFRDSKYAATHRLWRYTTYILVNMETSYLDAGNIYSKTFINTSPILEWQVCLGPGCITKMQIFNDTGIKILRLKLHTNYTRLFVNLHFWCILNHFIFVQNFSVLFGYTHKKKIMFGSNYINKACLWKMASI